MPPIKGIYLREYQVPWAPTHGGVKQVKDSNSPSTCNEETSDNSEEEIEAQCHMAGSATDSEDSTPEPEDTESELEWDSEGNIPIKKALCEECDEVGDYWLMFECNRCQGVYHPPCITPDGKEAKVMDDRYQY
jgi:hypothetical protein